MASINDCAAMTSSRLLVCALLLQVLLINSKTQAQGQSQLWASGTGSAPRYSARYVPQDSPTYVRSVRTGRGQPLAVDQAQYRQYSDSRPIFSTAGRTGSLHQGRDPYMESLGVPAATPRHYSLDVGMGGGGSRSSRHHVRSDTISMGSGSVPRFSSLGVPNDRRVYIDTVVDGRHPARSGLVDSFPSTMRGYQGGMLNTPHGGAVIQQTQQQLNPFAGVRSQPHSFATTTNMQSSANLQPAGVMQPTYVQARPNVLHQQGGTRILNRATAASGGTTNILPVVIQQPAQVVPVPVHIPQNLNLRNLGGGSFGGGNLNNLNNMNGLSSFFPGMTPLIIKMEDMPSPQPRAMQRSQMSPFGMRSRSPLGGGLGMLSRNPTGDPRISMVKLDEGLNLMINYSNPYGNIMNLPAPATEEEANMLIRVLERAEAPEYIKHMVRVRPRPHPAAVAAVAAANNAAVANAAAAANAAAMAGAAIAAAGTAPVAARLPIVTNAAAVAPVAPAVAMATGMAGSPAVAVLPAAAGVGGGVGGVAGALTGDSNLYDDVPIDEIIAGAFIGLGQPASTATVHGGANYPVDHYINNGRFMLTSLDMELTPAQYAELQSPIGVGRKKRKALTNARSRWPGGVVPFEITARAFTALEQQLIQESMNKWSASTCIRFRPAIAADTNKLVFRQGKGCSSNVGMVGGSQFLTLQKECRVPKIIAHEIGHAIGLIHEHQRRDRDNFLKINYQNIKPGTNKDFDIFKAGSVEHNYASYDYMSIMHYGKTAFARDKNKITMEAVDPRYTNLMGRATNLSPSDWRTVNSMYGCGELSGGMMMSF